MNRRIFYSVSTIAVLAGVSVISIAQSAPPKDPYAAYYSQQGAADSAAMQGGPLGKPMPSTVKNDIGQTGTSSSGTSQYVQPYKAAPSSGYRAPASSPYAAPSGGSYAPPQDTTSSASGWAPLPQGEISSTYSQSLAGSYTPPAQTNAAPTSPPAQPQFYRGEAASPVNGGAYYGAQAGPQSGPQSGPMSGPNTRPAKPRWWQKFGFGNWDMRTDGHIKGSVAAVNIDGTNAHTTLDGMVRTEISTVTQNQTEYGVSLKLRGQRDPFHRGFGGSSYMFGQNDCPPNQAGCPSITLPGQFPRAVRGHTGQLYTFGQNEQREHTVQLEGAHIFLRSRYGDFTLGRDDGSAALFSQDTPSTLPLSRASNMRTDNIGLDMVKTVNDASGFAEKVTYTSPRLLGDTIGVGVQFGVSYAPSTEACGVDYCVRGTEFNNINAPAGPEMEDAIEFGLALDRTFGNGLKLEGTANYATASETSGFAGFDDLQSWGVGLSAQMGDWAFGTNYLNSNNGWAGDGDYTAYDAGLTWKPSQWGVTLGYGGASDDLAQMESHNALLGVSYDWNDNLSFGTGVQYITREAPVYNGTTTNRESQDGVGLFFEGGITF